MILEGIDKALGTALGLFKGDFRHRPSSLVQVIRCHTFRVAERLDREKNPSPRRPREVRLISGPLSLAMGLPRDLVIDRSNPCRR